MWLNTEHVPLKAESGEVQAVLILAQDVTEQVLARRRVEQQAAALRHSEELFRRTFDQSPIGAAIVGLDKRCLRKDGSILWGRLSVRGVRDAEGRLLYALPLVEDITERRQAEERVRQLATVVEGSSDFIGVAGSIATESS